MPDMRRVREMADDIREAAGQFISEGHNDADESEVVWDMANSFLEGEPGSFREAVRRELGF